MIVEKINIWGHKHVTCPYLKLGISNSIIYRNLFKLFKIQGPSPYFKPLHMALRLFMLLTLFTGFWELIKEFIAAAHGDGGNHMLLTLKMLCGLAVIALMEVTIAKERKRRRT